MLFEASALARSIGTRVLFEHLSFSLEAQEALVVTGPSGAGKTQLLRALAWLEPLAAGTLRLRRRTPPEWGIPNWRAKVTYVAQTPPELVGTPSQYVQALTDLKAQATAPGGDAVELAASWGLPASAWSRPWSELSGGERQRAYLAARASRDPEVLLLDEPTAALDPAAARAVEASLRDRTAVWATHDLEQAKRVGGKSLELGK